MTTGSVGPLELPLAPGSAHEKLEDPLVEKLLDFSAFVIKKALDKRLHNLVGTPSDAVPTDKRHAFDPREPRGISIKLDPPMLFVWWKDKSELSTHSSIYMMRKRKLDLMYVFPELPSTQELDNRAGLFNAVDAALSQVSFWRGHPDYETGQSIRSSLGYPCLTEWEYLGGVPGRFGIDEGVGATRRRKRHSGRDYPALYSQFVVYERVTPRDLTDDDLLNDAEFTIDAADGEHSDGVEGFMIRYLSSPDGSKEE